MRVEARDMDNKLIKQVYYFRDMDNTTSANALALPHISEPRPCDASADQIPVFIPQSRIHDGMTAGHVDEMQGHTARYIDMHGT